MRWATVRASWRRRDNSRHTPAQLAHLRHDLGAQGQQARITVQQADVSCHGANKVRCSPWPWMSTRAPDVGERRW